MKAILLDIEGTTTPVDFVYKVLFPYAKEKLAEYIYKPDFAEDLAFLEKEHAADKNTPDCPQKLGHLEYLQWMMSKDRKSTALKSIQGKIWQAGYVDGAIQGALFPDVVEALQSWKQSGIPVYIYSSGSILAQKLLFGHTEYGDLTPLLSGYFDTTTGPKLEAESYRKISDAIKCKPEDITFFSDNPKELDAAKEAGMKIFLAERPGNAVTGRQDLDCVTSLVFK